MPRSPATGRQPRWSKDAAKYLLDDEPPVLATRRHWAVLIVPTLKFLPVVLIGGWLFLLDPQNRLTTTLGLAVVAYALVVFGLRVGEWWMRHFIVSRRRVLLTSGVIVRTVTLLPLRRITDLTWKETLLGQLLGYGTFRFESAGQQQALSEITYLPRADVLYRQVSGLLFSSDWGASGGDDEGNPEPEQPVAEDAPTAVERTRRGSDPLPRPGHPPPQQP